ncbi:MAG: hypothetical protein RMI49_03190 [Candidatus Caldarchaeum sp.]|nr:hypothetical protein [Candidatus Caldarchaeum sp.]
MASYTALLTLSVDRSLLWVLDVFTYDAGPVIASFGIAWLISSLHPMRKWYLYAAVSGVFVSAVSFTISSFFSQGDAISLGLISLTWGVGPSMILSAVIASVLVNRRVAKAGIVLPPNRHEDELDVMVLVGLYIPLLPLITDVSFYMRYLAPVVITWFIWHLVTPKFAAWLVKRQSGAGNELVAAEAYKPIDTTLFNVLSRSYYPMAFGLGVTTTVTSVLDLLGIKLFGGDPLSATANAAFFSVVAIALGSVYVGPVLWIFEDSGIRIYNRIKKTMKEPSIHSLADEMIEIYTFIFSPIGFTFAVADGDLVLAIILLALAFHLLFTISMTTTYLYLKFSANKHLHRFVYTLGRDGVLKPMA